jgi:tRNA 2-thiouridine synthesizing protein A
VIASGGGMGTGTEHGGWVRAPDGCDVRLDCSGMRCPQPVLRLAAETAETPAGTIVDIVGDCPTFEKDVRVFCERRRKTILAVRSDGATKCIRIQY